MKSCVRLIRSSRSVSTSGMTENHCLSRPSRSRAARPGTRSLGNGICARADATTTIERITQIARERRNMDRSFPRPVESKMARQSGGIAPHSSLADDRHRVKLEGPGRLCHLRRIASNRHPGIPRDGAGLEIGISASGSGGASGRSSLGVGASTRARQTSRAGGRRRRHTAGHTAGRARRYASAWEARLGGSRLRRSRRRSPRRLSPVARRPAGSGRFGVGGGSVGGTIATARAPARRAGRTPARTPRLDRARARDRGRSPAARRRVG